MLWWCLSSLTMIQVVLDKSPLKVLPTNIRAVSHLIVRKLEKYSVFTSGYPGLSYVQA